MDHPKVDHVVDANSKTFCLAPWFVVRTQWDGEYRPCCELKPHDTDYKDREVMHNHSHTLTQWQHSGYMQHLRQQFADGQQPPECRNCWAREAAGLVSQREILNENLAGAKHIQDTWAASYLRHRSNDPEVLMADVKVSNVCNYGCVMCSPVDSSVLQQRWQTRSNNQLVQRFTKNDPAYFDRIREINSERHCYSWLDSVLEQPVRVLKFLGGEPLLDKRTLNRLAQVPAERAGRISLNFVTNGSQDMVAVARQLAHFQHVNFVVSLEGYGAVQEWARQGSVWSDIVSHIRHAQQSQLRIQVHHTLQASTLLKLDQLLTWCDQLGIIYTFGMLEQPEHLSIQVLSDSLLELARTKLQAWPQVVDFVQVDSNPTLRQQFLTHVKWHDQFCDRNLFELVPELDQL